MFKYPRYHIIENHYGIHDLGFNKSIMLADLIYFSSREKELDQWCQNNGARRSGMIIDFPSEAVLSLFIIKWS